MVTKEKSSGLLYTPTNGSLAGRVNDSIQALINNTLQSFVLLDKEHTIIDFNKIAQNTLKRFFGINISNGTPFQIYFTKKDFKIFDDGFKMSHAGNIYKTEHDLKDVKGRTHTFNFSYSTLLDNDGQVASVAFTMQDITPQKKVKSDLIQSEALIESIFHTTDIGIALVNEKGRFVKVNEGFCKLLKYTIDELSGKSYLKIIPSASRKEVKATEELLLKGTNENFTYRVIDKEGDILDVKITNKLFIAPQGERYVIKTIRDISDERRYEDLFLAAEKIMRIGSFEYNHITKKLTCTREVHNIFEVDQDYQFTIQNFRKFIHKEDRLLAEKIFKELMRHRKTTEREFRVLTANKNEKWVLVRSMPLLIKSRLMGFRGSLLDITTRKQAEQEIEQLSWVARHTNNGVIITNSKGRIEWVNQSFERMMGFMLTEIIGKNPGEILHGDETDKNVVKRINGMLKKKLPVKEVLLNYTKEGRPIWISMDIAPIFENRKLIHFIGIVTDITELIYAKEIQKNQEALVQRQRLMDAIAGNFPDGIIGIINRELKYIYVGGRELRKLGHRINDLLGDNIFDKISEEANNYAKPFLQKVFEGQNAYFEVSVQDEIYSVYAVPIDRKEKPILRSLVVIQNITKRKKTEQDILEALNQQKELNELKSRFVTLASHEFRTPLATILSSADLASRFGELHDEENYKKHLKRIKSSVKNMTEILNEFLLLSKIEEGVVRNNPVPFNVKEFCEELKEEIGTMTRKNQVVRYHHQGDFEMVTLDQWHLKNILSNLLSNAVKYSPEESVIDFTSIMKMDSIRFVIKDQGIGIPDEDKPYLYDTFYRAKNANNIQGTGIGLNIVKRYLTIMGGTIAFESELNKGSTFTVVLPHG